MDYGELFAIADRARSGVRLSAKDAAFVRNEVPEAMDSFPQMKLPNAIKHPGGFAVSGAPVRTFVHSALLLAGQKVLGRRYGGNDFYERAESDLALAIMRSHFHRNFPKGTHCCPQCTLAVLPVLEANAIRHFDCRSLAKDVRRIIHAGEWRFARPANPAMMRWALSG